ncbi:MarR family winged helix-turn-helix transcriptional regulator [Paenibacillus daejeonensis]|uniref:MarR family winged helix-turn-helix transcriptional regulator n=1 Tax=Paenibacillus daejeonensis TaxID=135193 RepID=UPI0003619EE2|nr:MarR family winged helix-turn-helix transcriptional regulator [Paenibacillus daejeonensis]
MSTTESGRSVCSDAPVESAGKYVSAIYRHLQMLIADGLKPYRIGSGQYIFLITIADQEGITQKGLSEELVIDKTTTAKAVSKLESEGYVKRVASAEDQRFNQLYLTEAGYEVLPHVRARLRGLVGVSRQGMTDEEYELLVSLLKRMLSNVCAEVHNEEGRSEHERQV